MTLWVSVANCCSCASCIRFREYVLTTNTRDMPSISRHMLLTHFMSRPCNPIASVSAPVAKDILVRFVRECLRLLVESLCVSATLGEWESSLSAYHDMSVDFTCCHAEHFVLLGYVTRVTRKILLSEGFALV
jgi:hypothetical protein